MACLETLGSQSTRNDLQIFYLVPKMKILSFLKSNSLDIKPILTLWQEKLQKINPGVGKFLLRFQASQSLENTSAICFVS